jgi:hypothetical protein
MSDDPDATTGLPLRSHEIAVVVERLCKKWLKLLDVVANAGCRLGAQAFETGKIALGGVVVPINGRVIASNTSNGVRDDRSDVWVKLVHARQSVYRFARDIHLERSNCRGNSSVQRWERCEIPELGFRHIQLKRKWANEREKVLYKLTRSLCTAALIFSSIQTVHDSGNRHGNQDRNYRPYRLNPRRVRFGPPRHGLMVA